MKNATIEENMFRFSLVKVLLWSAYINLALNYVLQAKVLIQFFSLSTEKDLVSKYPKLKCWPMKTDLCDFNMYL